MGSVVTGLRSEVMQHWTPPGGGWHGALNHVVIHGLDVTVPLGVPRRSPDATIRVVLDDLTVGGVQAHFGTSIEGRSLQATTLTGPRIRPAATRQGRRPGARALRPDNPARANVRRAALAAAPIPGIRAAGLFPGQRS